MGLVPMPRLVVLVVPALEDEGQERNLSGALDGCGKFALVFGAIACLTTWTDFAILDDETPQHITIFVVNYNVFVGAKLADFWPRKIAAFSTLAGFIISIVIHGRLTPCPKKKN
jgi:hypothetical protein